MSTIYCPYRREHVVVQPEETVRQQLLHIMTSQLGYPPGCIVVEKALSQLPHLSLKDVNLPDRRVDILVYTNVNGVGLTPLLLIECKAVPLKPAALQQVAGYNHYIQAPFIAVANSDKVFCGWQSPSTKKYEFVEFIPNYRDLVSKL